MAVVTLSPLVSELHGKLGNSCLRSQFGRTIWETTPDPVFVPTTARNSWRSNLLLLKSDYSSFRSYALSAWPFSKESLKKSWWAWHVQTNSVANQTRQCIQPFPNDSDLPGPSYLKITNLGANSFKWDWDGELATSAYWFAIGVKPTALGHSAFGSVGNNFSYWSANLKTATRLAPQIVGMRTWHWFINKTTKQFSKLVPMLPPY